MVRVLLAFLLMAGQHAQAAETAAIQLSCYRPDGPNEGLVVNLAAGTVTGFNVVAHIESTDDTSISFSGEGPWLLDGIGPRKRIGTNFVAGTLDRITGALSVQLGVQADCQLAPADCSKFHKDEIIRNNFNMVCKATNRLF